MIHVCGRYPSTTAGIPGLVAIPQAPMLFSKDIVVDDRVYDDGVTVRLDDEKYPEMWLEVRIPAEKIREWAEELHCTKEI